MPRDSETKAVGPIRAENPTLPADVTVGQSFAALSEAGLKHLARNVEAFLARPEPDPVHQARVAVRRLRALLSAYRAALPKPGRKAVAADLKRAYAPILTTSFGDLNYGSVLPDILRASVRISLTTVCTLLM